MTVNSCFEKFLENIEPEKKYKRYAIEAHTRVREYLESEDSQFSQFVIDSFLYGSYARNTAIGNIKDVDIALITNFDPNSEECRPSKVLPALKRALNRLYKDPDATSPNRKSIQVVDPLPDEKDASLTLDIIPAVLTGSIDEKLLVPDMQDDNWVESNPKGHLKFTSDLNQENVSNGMFVPLVKIIKHWWKQHSGVENAKPKGFWLEILIGEEFDTTKDNYADLFVQILKNIKNRFVDYENYREVPLINDPGLPHETLKTSMTLAEFTHFMDAVNDTYNIAEEALLSKDENDSIALWNAIFGDEFPKPEQKLEADISKIINFINSFFAPNEQYLTRDFNIRFENLGYKVKIDGWVTKNKGFPDRYCTDLPLIQKKASILFKIINTTAPEPYNVMWKVKNTGKEAARLHAQRGELVWDEGKKQKIESTLYTGTHYVECYIIDNRNVCIAWNRIKVRII